MKPCGMEVGPHETDSNFAAFCYKGKTQEFKSGKSSHAFAGSTILRSKDDTKSDRKCATTDERSKLCL